MKIGVTGSSGFIGSQLLPRLRGQGFNPAVLGRDAALPSGLECVVHLGGLAHQKASQAAFHSSNHQATLRVARAARDAGVSRFVFVSSIAVVAGYASTVLTPDLAPKPLNDYGHSKAIAEAGLLGLDGMEVVILRPPLVFGPNPKGNFRSLMKLCASGVPLPFASVRNRRSMIGVSNLCSVIQFLATADGARVAGRIFHVEEAEQFALYRIVEICRQAMGIPRRMFAVSPSVLGFAMRAAGLGKTADQLLSDLVVDASSLVNAGWQRGDTSASDMEAMARSA